jgi:hypothetical protein
MPGKDACLEEITTMTPSKIIFIRHAEKPENGVVGVSPSGTEDGESLTVKGWQRAGALISVFAGAPAAVNKLVPNVVFASGLGVDSASRRPQQTVTPLVQHLSMTGRVDFVTSHLKEELQPLMGDVLTRDGVALICWEHKRIPALVRLLPHAPEVPNQWDDLRFDVTWIFDRDGDTWRLSQAPHLLLQGDIPDPIK